MKKKFILLPLAGFLAYVILSSYSSGPGFSGYERTGVTGTIGCGTTSSGCHSNSATTANTISIELRNGTTPVTTYVGGQALTIRLTSINGGSSTLANFGFQLTAVLGSGTTNAGTLGVISGLTHVTTAAGISVAEHSSPRPATTAGGASGATYVIDIPWTAPTSGSGSVTLRSTMNLVNGGGADAGDLWNNTSSSIAELGAITGVATTCVASSTTLSNSFSGGTWSTTSSNATVSSTGVVTGTAIGTAVITYTGGGNFTTKIVTINAAPSTTISGSLTVCQTQTTNLTNSVSGGTWSSTSANVSVTGTGGVTGVNAGTAVVSYSIGSCQVTAVVTINPLAANTGTMSVCEGSTTLLSNINAGGTWTSSVPANGSVVATSGLVTGVAAGTTNITYSLSTGCNAVSTVTVNTQPPAIGGPTAVCNAATITATNSAAGLWSSSTAGPGSVSINASTGVVTGIVTGSTTITYTASGGCFATELISVNPLPSPILGGFVPFCAGSTITLTSATSGGTWTSGSPAIAPVDAGGVVTGLSTAGGTSLISYTLGTGCKRTINVTVNPISPITGGLNVCTGLTTALSSGPAGGTWSSSTPAVGTVSTAGVVTGLTSGTTGITYTSGTCTASTVVTVGSLSPITGGGAICVGSTLALANATGGGTWSSSTGAVGTINASTGLFTALGTGTTSVAYTTSSGCSTSTIITVNAAPGAVTASGGGAFCSSTTITASGGSGGTIYFEGTTSGGVSTATPSTSQLITSSGTYYFRVQSSTGCWGSEASVTVTINPLPAPITGIASVCIGATTTLNSTTTGGTWSSPSGNVSVAAATGGVTGVAAGTANVTYTVTGGCTATQVVTVNPLPADYTISPLCAGATATLATTPSGGTWSSGAGPVATIGASSGLITAVSAGTANITYTLGTGCILVKVETVNPLPTAIGGTAVICQGATTTLNSTPAGGTWTSSDVALGTVNAGTGAVTGISAGNVNITYTLATGCQISKQVTINPLPVSVGTLTVCTGATVNLSTSTLSYVSSDPGIFTVNSSGVLTGIAAGTATLTFTSLSTGCSNTRTVTVNASPSAISGGPSAVCVGSSITLSSSPGTGTWSSASGLVSVGATSGIVTGVSSGVANVSYTLSTGCGVATVVTVNPLPATITGTFGICQDFNTTLNSATTGGTWSSSNTSVAIVAVGSGVVTGAGVGTSSISYTLGTGCMRTAVVSVNEVPAAITGTPSTCVGTSTTLSTTSTGGSWTSGATGVATAGPSSGIITGISTGTATISYSFSTGCFTSTTLTVNPVPSAGTITGSSSVCTGLTVTLFDAVSGGTWSASNGNVTVSSSGVVTGVTAGTTTVTYTVSSGCGTVFATKDITITTSATAGEITGTLSVCLGTTTALSSTVTGGTWTSSNTSVASITSPGGVVSGLSVSTATITYTITSGCGTASTTAVVTVNPVPGPIIGAPVVCAGGTLTLPVATGTWSSSNSSVASVDAGGTLTGVSAGTATLTFTLTSTGCITTAGITVNPQPSAITGTLEVCTGTPATLASMPTGGTWSSSTTSVAFVGSGSGTVTPLTPGTTTISYTISTGCVRTAVFTVNTTPASITGLIGICIGNNTTLNNTLSGGTWASSNIAIGTIDETSGVFTGISAGTSVITYTMPTGCRRTGVATVNALPAAITGASTLCTGTTTPLADITSGGVWASDNIGIATVGSSSGIVTGISSGTSIITYTAPTGCSRSTGITVNPLPAAISGTGAICAGSTLVLSNATSGGSWSSGAAGVATVNATSGTVTGISAGTALISYSLPTGCYTTAVVTVNALPSAFTGAMAVCEGGTTTLSSTPTGGTWASGTTLNATVDPASGVVTGISAGTSAITYTASGTGCMRIGAVTVNPVPSSITGTAAVCTGNTTTLSGAPAGGTWASGSSANATVGLATGIVSGVASGTAGITYTLATGCSTSAVVTVNTTPTITGPGSVCPAGTITLSGSVSGGTWASSAPAVGTVSASGVVTGIAPGTTTITYTLPATGCSSANLITVNALTSAGAITGASSVCVGATITMTESISGGVWSATNGNATISTAGVVTGVVSGVDTILYTVTGICGAATAMQIITVNPLPVAGTITGTAIVCVGNISVLSGSIPGGEWSTGNPSVATVDLPGGIVTGVAVGTAAITYTTINSCGTAPASIIVTVLPTVDAGTISGVDTVCQGATITLTNTGSGGTWASSSSVMATVSATGVVTGVAPGTVTILYIVANACSRDTATHVVTVRSVADCTSDVKSISLNGGLKVYPNPNGGTFTVELPVINSPMTITIQDMLGKTIEKRIVDASAVHTVTFTLNNIAAGSYMVSVNTGEQIFRQKLVIW